MHTDIRTSSKIITTTEIRTWSRVTTTEYYLNWQPLLLNFLKESRRLQGDDKALLDLQVQLLKAIYEAENAVKVYKRHKERWGRALRRLAETGADQQRRSKAQAKLENVGHYATAARWIARYLRSIGDGIVWRLMSYNRAKILVLVEHEPPGAIQLGRGLDTEVTAAYEILSERRGAIILNAVTNFNRVADICVVDRSSGSIQLVEVKASHKTTAKTTRQATREAEIAEAISKGVSFIDGHAIQELVAPGKLKTYHRSIGNALLEATEKGASSRLFGNYLGVACADTRFLQGTSLEEFEAISQPHMDRALLVRRGKSDEWIFLDSLVAVQQFAKNMAPYTIFPFPEELCVPLMTGQLLVVSVLNLSGLAAFLSKRDWQASFAKTIPRDKDGKPSRDATFMTLSKGPWSVEITGAIIAAAMLEFWAPESIADMAEAQYATRTPLSKAPYKRVVFRDEWKTWD